MNQGIRRALSVVAMTLLLAGTLAACGTASDEVEPTVTREEAAGAPPTRTPTSEAEESPAAPAATPGGDGGGEAGEQATTVEVSMVELAFEPAEFTIPANTDVTINAVNNGALPHSFTITDVADTGEVAAGDSASVTVNLPPGEYEFICTVPGHADGGMVGVLTVAEDGGETAAASPAGDEPQESDVGGLAAEPTTIEVDMVEMAFDPSDITIPANVDVTVNLTNSGVLEHTFTIDDVVDSGAISGGDTGSVTINLPAGEYEIYCAIPGHKESGMVATLTVAEAADTTGAPGEVEEATPADGTPAADGSPEASPVAGGTPAATSVDVDMVELRFIPEEFEIAANTPVTINLSNSGNLPHNFEISDQDISVDVAAGEATTFELDLPAGTYAFICNVPGHADAGMVGTLTVK